MDDSPRDSSKTKDKTVRQGGPSAARPEFEVAHHAKAPGGPLRRKLLQTQLARMQAVGGEGGVEASPGEDLSPVPAKNRTWDDRAG